METKNWWQSKTVWAAIIAVIVTAYNAIAPYQKWPEIPEAVYALLGAFGLYGIRTANTTITSSAPAPRPTAPDNVVPAAPPASGLEEIR